MPCRAFFDSDRAQDLKILPHLRRKNRLKLSILSHRAGMKGFVGLPVSHPAGVCAPPLQNTFGAAIFVGGAHFSTRHSSLPAPRRSNDHHPGRRRHFAQPVRGDFATANSTQLVNAQAVLFVIEHPPNFLEQLF